MKNHIMAIVLLSLFLSCGSTFCMTKNYNFKNNKQTNSFYQLPFNQKLHSLQDDDNPYNLDKKTLKSRHPHSKSDTKK